MDHRYISQMSCSGYKAFERHVEMHLAPLTLIFGKNNSGKTALTRLPIFAGLSSRSSAGYIKNYESTEFGASYRNIANLQNPHPSISYAVEFSDGSGFESRTRLLTEDLQDRLQVSLSRFRVPGGSESSSVVVDFADAGSSSHFSMMSEVQDLVNKMTKFLHISSFRPNVAEVYALRDPRGLAVGEVPYLLQNDSRLLDEVSAWFHENFDGMTIEIEKSPYAFRLVTPDVGQSVSLAAVGRGYQSVLPVITLLIAAMSGRYECDLIVIEEPEAHLHPSAHAAVSELLLEASKSVQVIAETHSENAILRARRRIAEKHFEPDEVSLIYVSEDKQVSRLHVDQMGGVSDWPSGVFEYDLEEARAIVDVKLRAYEERPNGSDPL